MPIANREEFDNASLIVEDRKIKLGEKLSNRPGKLKAPIVTMTLKGKGQSNFPEDDEIMDAIRERYGITTRADLSNSRDKPGDIPGVPVFCVSDDVYGNIYIYRGMWRQSGSLCLSPLGEENARRWFATEPHKVRKELKILSEPDSVKCDSTCHVWDDSENCKWSAVVSLQLADRPRFPSVTRYRTTGWYVIQTMLASLKAIKEMTGGILMGIPLVLRKYEMDVRVAGTGDTRRIPVVVFDFDGTIQDLRRFAVEELNSRQAVKDAAAGMGGIKAPKSDEKVKFAPGSLLDKKGILSDAAEGEIEELNDILEDDPKEEMTKGEAVDEDLIADIKILCGRLEFTERRLEMLIDKHGGDFGLVKEELQRLSKSEREAKDDGAEVEGDFSPGGPGAEQEEEEPAPEQQKSEDPYDDDAFLAGF